MLLKDKNCPPVKLLEEIPENLRVFNSPIENKRSPYKEMAADFELDELYSCE
jgi:hypothetical protein